MSSGMCHCAVCQKYVLRQMHCIHLLQTLLAYLALAGSTPKMNNKWHDKDRNEADME
jgi:hypothetical protein